MSYTPLDARQLAIYCQRIGFTGTAHADLATLKSLHYLHPVALPFENLDTWQGLTPSLQEAAVFDKLVTAKRGGYCFEHNQLFMRALLGLGFTVHGLSARVIMPDSVLPRTHMALLVVADGESWLADVGFGGLTMTAPLQLSLSTPQSSSHEAWQLEAFPAAFMLSAQVQGNWLQKYCFSLEPQTPGDYEMANWYVATWPSSRFINDLIASRADQGCRHALLNRRYMQHRLGQSSIETEITSAEQLLHLLQNTFRINISKLPSLATQLQRLFPAR